MRIEHRLSVLLAALAAVVLTAGCMQAPPREQEEAAPQPETIIFNDLTWDSARVQNRIAQYIVEKGYGYATGVVAGPSVPLMEGLRRGESHVTMEVWLPNQSEAWEAAEAAGEVAAVGETLNGIEQATFMIPAYLQDAYPELDSVEDLKEEQYQKLFATAESDGKIRFLSCPAGWGCEAVNAAKVEGYGLADHVQIVVPESDKALNDDVFARYAAGEPWIGYLSGEMPAALKLDMVALQEPLYSDECWASTKACAYEDTKVVIGVRAELLANAPEVAAMLRKWDMSIERYRVVGAWQVDNEAGAADAAYWWLRNNAETWSQWVTPEADEAIQAALDAGEIPAGWPAE